jgi:hypothetical protein
VWINSDVCGPDDKDRPVLLRLEGSPAPARTDLASLPPSEVAAYVDGLSTRARFDQFAVDYRFPFRYAADGDALALTLGDAMDFLTRKDYTDNWLSETREQFCGFEFADWKRLLTDVGFEILPASRTTRNDWIVANRLAPVATLTDLSGAPLAWPVTHVFFVARRPLNT